MIFEENINTEINRRCPEEQETVPSNAGEYRSGTSEILRYTMLKIAQRRRIDVELPLRVRVGAHPSFHLVDLAERKHD